MTSNGAGNGDLDDNDLAEPSLEQRPATTAITAGRGANGTSLAPPLWSSSVWTSTGLVDARRRATGQRSKEFYGRYGNPTCLLYTSPSPRDS